MNNDKFPGLSDPEDNLDASSIIKKSSPKPFDFGGLLSEGVGKPIKSESEEIEEDEEDEKSAKKRFPVLLKKIFPKTLQEKPSSNKSIFDEYFKSEPMPASENDNPEQIIDDEGIVVEKSEINRSFIEEKAHIDIRENEHDSVSEVYAPEDVEEDISIKEPAKTSKEKSTEDSGSSDVQSSNNLLAVDKYPPRVAPPIINPTIYPEFTAPPLPESSTQFTQEKVIIEKKQPIGAVFAFLAADLISRRRDRKITKELKKQSKKTNKKFEEITEKTNDLLAESVESILKRKQYESTSIRSPEKVIEKKAQPNLVETVEKTLTGTPIEQSQEQPSKQWYESGIMPNVVEHPKQYTLQTPEQTPVQKVEAPTNKARERLFFPGKPTVPESLNTNEVNPENILAKYSQGQRNYQSFTPGNQRISRTSQTLGHDPLFVYSELNKVKEQNIIKGSATYKKSVQTGFSLALLILFILLVLYALN